MSNGSGLSSYRKVLIVAGVIILLVIAVGIITLPSTRKRWSQPLGPGLELPTHTATEPGKLITATSLVENKETSTPDTAKVETENPESVPEITETKEPTATQEPFCGGPELMYILGIGVDTKDNSYSYGLADVIRVARVDFMTPKITVLTVPRDLWVEIPDISDNYGITHGKLNQAYFYGGPGMAYYDGPGGGPGLLVLMYTCQQT